MAGYRLVPRGLAPCDVVVVYEENQVTWQIPVERSANQQTVTYHRMGLYRLKDRLNKQ